MRFASRLGILFLTFSLLVGCSNFTKLVNGNDFDAKYKAAVSYYEKRNYTKAIQLLENLIMHYHGKENAENISWYYAQALMAEKDYFSAGYQFKNFFKRFPYSDRAEEALFLSANCKYHESPDYYLDQKLTKDAIAEYESYVDRYPNSVHIPEINTRLDELRYKLMHKAEDLLMSTGCICPLYFYTDMYLLSDKVDGFFSNPLGYTYFMYTTIN